MFFDDFWSYESMNFEKFRYIIYILISNFIFKNNMYINIIKRKEFNIKQNMKDNK